ncbi:hypothetical protein PTI98_008120 [Pleurotus ostreatus]|nr:hypothetical protein PTI98_008120 [Pleurotus ostreatus]
MLSIRSLPQELTDMVIEHVVDRDDKKQCALVCRSWRVASQRQLFAHLDFMINQMMPVAASPTARFHEALAHSPHLTKYALHICILIIGFDDEHGHSKAQQQLFVSMLPKFRRVASMEIHSPFPTNFSRSVDTSLLAAVHCMLSSQLKRFGLVGLWEFNNLLGLLKLLGTDLPSLESLTLGDILILDDDEEDWDVTYSDGAPIVIQFLRLTLTYLPPLIGWFSRHRRKIIVDDLHLNYLDEDAADELLNILSPNLRTLTLCPSEGRIIPYNFKLSTFPLLNKLSIPLLELWPVPLLERPDPDNIIQYIELRATLVLIASSPALCHRLDDLLSSSFPRLISVTIVSEGDIHQNVEMKPIRRYLRKLIDLGKLLIRLSTGQILSSSDVIERSAQMYYPGDFPFFIDTLETLSSPPTTPQLLPSLASILPDAMQPLTEVEREVGQYFSHLQTQQADPQPSPVPSAIPFTESLILPPLLPLNSSHAAMNDLLASLVYDEELRDGSVS